MEENHDFGHGEEFGEELDEDDGSRVTGLVEEDAEAWRGERRGLSELASVRKGVDGKDVVEGLAYL